MPSSAKTGNANIAAATDKKSKSSCFDTKHEDFCLHL